MTIELINNNKFKYLFSTIAHFSKLSNCYLLINKKAESILDSTKEFFQTYDNHSNSVVIMEGNL